MSEERLQPTVQEIAVSPASPIMENHRDLSHDLNKPINKSTVAVRIGGVTGFVAATILAGSGAVRGQEPSMSPEPSLSPDTVDVCPDGYHIQETDQVLSNGDLVSFPLEESPVPEASPVPSATPAESINPDASPSPEANIEIVDETTGEITICIPDEIAEQSAEPTQEASPTPTPEINIEDYSLESFLALPDKKLPIEGFEKLIKKESKKLADYYKANGYPKINAAQVLEIELNNLDKIKADPRFNTAAFNISNAAIITLEQAQKAAKSGNIEAAKALKNKAYALYRVGLSIIDFGNRQKTALEAKFREVAKQRNFE